MKNKVFRDYVDADEMYKDFIKEKQVAMIKHKDKINGGIRNGKN